MCRQVRYYQITRHDNGVDVSITNREGVVHRKLHPARSQAIRNHSPDGFEFGYGGSGPAQLALAILVDVLNDDALAERLYQKFKWKFIATMTGDRGDVSTLVILDWVSREIVTPLAAPPSAN